MGVKTIITLRKHLPAQVDALGQDYNTIIIYFPGSPQHTKHQLREDGVLIRAYNYKPRPDKRHRKGRT